MVGRLSRQPLPVSVIIVTHDSAALIGPVLEAVEASTPPPAEIIVVDSASGDATVDLLRDRPVTLIPSTENVGFARGCHVGVQRATERVVALLGHDAVPRSDWLEPLVAALDEPGVGAAMATLEDADQPGTFNTSGGHLTYFGLAFLSDHGVPIPDETGIRDVPFPSGGAMAMRRDVWARFGGFRGDFFMYHEDTDLGWRLRLAGLRTVRVSASRVLHHYDFGRAPRKMYLLERNRLLMLRTNYRRRTLLVLTPALVLVELGTAFVAARDGWLAEKAKAWWDGLGTSVGEARAAVSELRTVDDGNLIADMDFRLAGIRQVRPPRGTALIDVLLGWWQRLALPLVRILERL